MIAVRRSRKCGGWRNDKTPGARSVFPASVGFPSGWKELAASRRSRFAKLKNSLAACWRNIGPEFLTLETLQLPNSPMPMSLSGDSRVRTSQERASAPACPVPVQDSTGNWCEPFAWFDRNTRSWRTWQTCLVDLLNNQASGFTKFSGTWPRSGLVLNGIAYQRKPSAPLTSETAFGSLLPTPTSGAGRSDGHNPFDGGARARSKAMSLGLLPTPRARMTGMVTQNRQNDKNRNLGTALAREILPTPRASDSDRGGRGDLLTVLRGYETRHAGTLPTPTPTARDTRSGKASEATHAKNSRPLNETLARMSGNTAGRTNPRFLEWMMGFPTGHTELKPSETR